jgi:hypothetical protein
MVDIGDLKSPGRKAVRVRVPLAPPRLNELLFRIPFFLEVLPLLLLGRYHVTLPEKITTFLDTARIFP